MNSKTNATLKIVLTFIAVCIFLFGWMGGFINSFNNMNNYEIVKYYDQRPLNDKNGIVVDSEKNIYIGDMETGSIQVYDSLGNFRYGFSFPTGGAGMFSFGIEQNKIYIVAGRSDSFFVFDKGDLIFSEEEVDDYHQQELEIKYNMTEDNEYYADNKIYEISAFNTVSIKDSITGEVERISLRVPFWPFSHNTFYLIMVVGIGLIFAMHHKFISSITEELHRKY
ncbi:MAG: hypothetical protein AB9836_07400 [Aminipila sp.]